MTCPNYLKSRYKDCDESTDKLLELYWKAMNIKKRRELILEYLNHKGERSVEQIHKYVCSKIIGPYNSENMLRKMYRDIDALEKSGELLKRYYDTKTGLELEGVENKKRYIMKCHSVIESSYLVGEDLINDLEIRFQTSYAKPEAWSISIVKDKKQPSIDSFCFVFKFKENYICIEAITIDAPLSLVIAGRSSSKIDPDYFTTRFGNNAALLEIPLETLLPLDSNCSGHTIIHFNEPKCRGEEFVRVNYAYKLSKVNPVTNESKDLFDYLKKDLQIGWISWSRANDFIEDANFEGILTHCHGDDGLTWIEKKSLAINKGDISKLIATPRPRQEKITAKKETYKRYSIKESRLTKTFDLYKLRSPSNIAEYLPLRVMSGGLEFIIFVAYKNPKELILKKAS